MVDEWIKDRPLPVAKEVCSCPLLPKHDISCHCFRCGVCGGDHVSHICPRHDLKYSKDRKFRWVVTRPSG